MTKTLNKTLTKNREAAGGIQSLDIALRVLNTLAQSGRALPLSELARLCDLPPTKVHRYLASFCHSGILTQNGRSGPYDLGKGSIQLGLAAMNRCDFINSAVDHLANLVRKTNLTAYISVWSDSGPTVVRLEKSASPMLMSLALGTTLPLLTTATGRVFVANLPSPVTEQLLDKELKFLKQRSGGFNDFKLSKAGVKEIITPIKKAGFCATEIKFIPGLVTISAPILDWQNHVVAAVTLIEIDPTDLTASSKTITALTTFCAEHSLTDKRDIG